MLYPMICLYLAIMNLFTAGIQKTYIFFIYSIVFFIAWLVSMLCSNLRVAHQILIFLYAIFLGFAIGEQFVYGEGVLDYVLLGTQVVLMMLFSCSVQYEEETPSVEEGVSSSYNISFKKFR